MIERRWRNLMAGTTLVAILIVAVGVVARGLA